MSPGAGAGRRSLRRGPHAGLEGASARGPPAAVLEAPRSLERSSARRLWRLRVGLLGALRGVVRLHLLALLERAAVRAELSSPSSESLVSLASAHEQSAARSPLARHSTYALLGELVDALLRRGAAALDHVENALLVRHEADDLAHHLAHELRLLAGALPHTTT